VTLNGVKPRGGKLLAALAAAIVAGVALAQTPPVDAAYEHFYNLEFDSALDSFEKLAEQNPKAARLQNHVAQALLFREMLRAGALETELVTGGNAFLRLAKMNPSAADQRRFYAAVDAALRLTAAALASNPIDTEALYAQGVAYGLRSNYRYLVTKSWLDALRDATAARRAHQRLLELDPNRIDARMIPGTHEYVVGSLPWHYRALGFLAGFRGSRESGLRTLEQVAREGVNNRSDAQVLLATIYRRERRAQDAVALLKDLVRKYPRNYLFQFELAQMYSDLGDKEQALAAVAEVGRLKHAGTPGYEVLFEEKIIYFRSTIQFWYRDYDEALAGFRHVTAKAAQLDPNTGVTAWMRLGQTLDIKHQRAEALKAYRSAIAYAPSSGVAEECEEFLKKPYVAPAP
jgi:tetratricopeptide (TPR) repeat protein